jgi:beta-lactam-binding protein with PASTA domain
VETQNDVPIEDLPIHEETDDSKRNRSLFAGIALAVLVLLIIWWILSQLVVVPDVVGMQERDARATIEETGLSIGDVMTLPSATDPAGEVVATCPEAGVRIFKWGSVRLFVVSGDGDADDGAQQPDEGEVDLVWGAGADREPGATPVRPPGPQRVPQVFDLSESSAIARLQRDGYRATVEYGDSSTNVAAGLVFYQDPPPDTVAPRGTLVIIRVSTGPPVLGN